MRLTKGQITAILVVGALITFLFFKGFKTSSSSTAGQEQAAVESGNSFEALVEAQLAAVPEPLRKRMEKASEAKEYREVIALLDSLRIQAPAALMMEKVAEKEQVESSWMVAGSRFYSLAIMSNDSLLLTDAGTRAKHAFEKALELNPASLDAQNALASCYVDIDKDVMKGVGMLRQVVEKDSNNTQAIFTLGMLSIQSGQFDKAKQRFAKLISLQPFNPEYYYYLGEAEAKSGDTGSAIAAYEKCKTLLKDKNAQEEIQQLINKLKSI